MSLTLTRLLLLLRLAWLLRLLCRLLLLLRGLLLLLWLWHGLDALAATSLAVILGVVGRPRSSIRVSRLLVWSTNDKQTEIQTCANESLGILIKTKDTCQG